MSLFSVLLVIRDLLTLNLKLVKEYIIWFIVVEI